MVEHWGQHASVLTVVSGLLKTFVHILLNIANSTPFLYNSDLLYYSDSYPVVHSNSTSLCIIE